MLSIIMPVYNEESGICSKIDSVLSQCLDEIELIVVNDGSSDNTHNNIMSMNYDNRVRYFQKNNGGASSARNRGILESKGELIIFLDSDDSISSDLIKNILNKKIDKGVLYFFGTKFISSQKTTVSDYHFGTNDTNYIIKKSIIDESFNRVWGKIYDGNVIRSNNVRFDESLEIAEDLLFNLNYFKYCTTIARIDVGYYMYYSDVEGSLTNSINWSKVKSLIDFHKKFHPQLKDYGELDLDKALSFVLLKNKSRYMRFLFRDFNGNRIEEFEKIINFHPYKGILTPNLMWKFIHGIHSTNSYILNKIMYKCIILIDK